MVDSLRHAAIDEEAVITMTETHDADDVKRLGFQSPYS